MRIRRLAIAGFGPYKNEQHVDFDAFRDDGLFLISGRTGAGKSSILDAVCYALYGSIPRFDGAQPKLRSDHCTPDDPTFVELEFTLHDVDYRVRRVPDYERVKKSGTGTTVNKGTAELSRRVDGDWETFAAGLRDVALELDGILSLTKDQFLQVILLAQNRFQQFLLAKNDERQAVLRSLFGTSRFEQIEAALVEKYKALKVRLEADRQNIIQHAASAAALAGIDAGDIPAMPDLNWFVSLLDGVETEVADAEALAERADDIFTASDADHRARLETQKLQRRRDAALARLDELAAEEPSIAAQRELLAAARRAAAVRPLVTSRRDAAAGYDGAVTAESAARRAFGKFHDDAETVSLEALTADIDAVSRELGTLDSVVADEQQLPALDARIRSLSEAVDDFDAALADAETRITALPLQLDEVNGRIAEARIQSAGESAAATRVEQISAARDAALTVARLETKHAEALQAETAASRDNAAAASRVHQLMEQRLSGYAAELAGNLVDGDPCAVCGATVHPEPATGTHEAVTQDDIDDAQAYAETCAAALAGASATARAIATEMAAAAGSAGGRTVGDLDAELSDATGALSDARAAAAIVATLESDLAALRQELADSQSRAAALRAEREGVVGQLITSRGTRADIEARIETHRGDFDTVSLRVESLKVRHAAAVGLADAIMRTVRKQEALESATESLAAALREHEFITEEEAVDAQRSTAEMMALETRVRDHEQDLAIARSTVNDPEIRRAPEKPVDVDETAEALSAARDDRDRALATVSTVAERRRQLARIVAAVRKQHAASGQAQEEYAQLGELASAVQGKDPNTKRMRLETYVLAAQLEEIVAAANTRLRIMTSGRYTLQHDDSVQFRNTQSGLGLAILDEHTGRARATHSLSGGETFLASLALALGLAEVVTNQAGGITLDTLFIDEGFGSLDSETLEIAMGTLDSLRAGGRTIGLISHVDAMKEQIPAKLRITVTPHGYSEIEPVYELV